MNQPSPLCVGIDVSKATLGIAANGDFAQFTVSDGSDGFETITEKTFCGTNSDGSHWWA
ncbi:transposase [Escherichia coli]|nr:transposase [Escherichia coli]